MRGAGAGAGRGGGGAGAKKELMKTELKKLREDAGENFGLLYLSVLCTSSGF